MNAQEELSAMEARLDEIKLAILTTTREHEKRKAGLEKSLADTEQSLAHVKAKVRELEVKYVNMGYKSFSRWPKDDLTYKRETAPAVIAQLEERLIEKKGQLAALVANDEVARLKIEERDLTIRITRLKARTKENA